ncbi:hypothetical protein GCM10011402_34160 [Paracoccus acridae]|uniref:VPLPA-CTERM sorting domain-containing protein n=1 Tax=Paracoccus acridae TaxID=1795310 RepID=A0ABQ1VM67_9RHOB|nr:MULTISPECIES: VPLPA-CTERM sorting domain-containing protein [Paracoccus]GGF78696.1 hypothetical protein GCM10011402_34160 [Paracoccus acridae]
MSIMLKVAAFAAFAAMPFSAIAATVTHVFNSTALAPLYGSQGTEWTTADGFLTISSTGGDIFIGANALGVARPGQAVQLYQQLNINETLRFSFAAPVTDVTFGRSAGTFPVNLTSYDETGDAVYSLSRSFPNSIPVNPAVNGPDNLPILSFLLQGVSGTGAGIASITYTTADIPPPAPVPLPAAGFLLLGGMGALYGMRRKKAASEEN